MVRHLCGCNEFISLLFMHLLQISSNIGKQQTDSSIVFEGTLPVHSQTVFIVPLRSMRGFLKLFVFFIIIWTGYFLSETKETKLKKQKNAKKNFIQTFLSSKKYNGVLVWKYLLYQLWKQIKTVKARGKNIVYILHHFFNLGFFKPTFKYKLTFFLLQWNESFRLINHYVWVDKQL